MTPPQVQPEFRLRAEFRRLFEGQVYRHRASNQAQPAFDEFLVLRYRATNAAPFPFEWVDYHSTRLDYAAALSRIGSRYQQRF